jgi:hypothetical protein
MKNYSGVLLWDGPLHVYAWHIMAMELRLIALSGIQAACAARIGWVIALGLLHTHEALWALTGVNEVVENLGQIEKEIFFSAV